MKTSTWPTLIQREWLQHRIGWLTILLAPAALMLLAVTFTEAKFDADDEREINQATGQLASELIPGVLGVTVGGVTLYLVLGVVVIVTFLLAGGLARKDSDDRSIEFWLSMPTSHRSSVGATLLAHGVLLPLAALLVALFTAALAASIVALRAFGTPGVGQLFAADTGLPWASIALRTLAGLPVALFWLAPIYLTLVAAGAWFKRWGLPMLAGALFFAHVLVERVLGSDIVANTFQGLFVNALASVVLVHDVRKSNPLSQFSAAELTPERIWQTFGNALQALGSPLAAFALMVSVAMFWLIVLRRERGM